MSTIAHSPTPISDSIISRGIVLGMVLLFVLMLTFFFFELVSREQMNDLQAPNFEGSKVSITTYRFGQ